jgi:hypothetical protein
MFQALLAHPQEVLNKRHLVYWVLHQDWSKSSILVQPTDITRTQCTKCRLWIASWGWASNAQNMYRPLILNELNKYCITLVYNDKLCMMHGRQNIKIINQFYYRIMATMQSLYVSKCLIRLCNVGVHKTTAAAAM